MADPVINGYTITAEGNFLYFTPVDDIAINMEVEITFSSRLKATDGNTLGEDTDYFFTTQYYPVFATPKMIRAKEGLSYLIQDIDDDTIWRMIFLNSIRCSDRWRLGTKQYINIRDYVPWCAREYVIYTTVLDLAKLVTLKASTSGGSKTLGDLSVGGNGVTSFPGIYNNWLSDIAKQIEKLRKLVENGCRYPAFMTGNPIGFRNTDDPIPILHPNLTWKRFPKVGNDFQRLQSSRLSPNINQSDIRNAYKTGTYLPGDVSTPEGYESDL